MDFTKVINKIFLEAPKQKNYFDLKLDPGDNFNKNVNFNDILINIFITGCKTLYGENTEPNKITNEQFNNVNLYMESLGYTTHYEYIYNENNIATNINIWFSKCVGKHMGKFN